MAYETVALPLSNIRSLATLVNKKITTKKNYETVNVFIPGPNKLFAKIAISEPGKYIGNGTGKIANYGTAIMCEIAARVNGTNIKGWVNTAVVDAASTAQANSQAPAYNPMPDFIPDQAASNDYIPATTIPGDNGTQQTIPYTNKPKTMGGGFGSILLGIGLVFGSIKLIQHFQNQKKHNPGTALQGVKGKHRSKWQIHVKETMAKHPGKKFSEILKIAKSTY